MHASAFETTELENFRFLNDIEYWKRGDQSQQPSHNDDTQKKKGLPRGEGVEMTKDHQTKKEDGEEKDAERDADPL